jgi:phosphatidylserine/phosphatidylglycerophosphate/cardiolipin synthase-like enzyme
MTSAFEVYGTNDDARFTLKLHRGDGMLLLAMNWRDDTPPTDFVGFGIEYREPGGDRFFALKNRLGFLTAEGEVNPARLSTLLSPIQMFRWVHFPRNAELPGAFTYRVTPVFMNKDNELSYGPAQTASIELRRETYPGQLNVTFTRGFVVSQAFVDRFESAGPIATLLPATAADGLTFKPSHPKTREALDWMGFEARHAVLEVLDQAIADPTAQVSVVAYDLSEPDVVARLEKLKKRLRIVIDDSPEHKKPHSGETQAAKRLAKSAGAGNVKRQHMGSLQHNKTIVVDGAVKKAVCGSTNFSWRGFFVQSNHAVIVEGEAAIRPFLTAFDAYWESDAVADFGASAAADWQDLGLNGIDAKIAFSPHNAENALLPAIADDVSQASSSLLFSLAFLYNTQGPVRDAITEVINRPDVFVYGVSDRAVGGIDLQKPDGNIAPVFPAALTKNVPEPFKKEPKGGGGNRMHHKFVVVDFDKPTARVYLGSYNFSQPADRQNGENLLLIRDRRVVTSFMIEALRIFDHYHFRVAQQAAKRARKVLHLSRPPRTRREKPWFHDSYTIPRKIHDRELFSR